ncbi:MAG TPA: hypothetical protein VK509_06510 [Polyangiales bacterium]|nr:hypothetical protein [Polyangiales bacterium]
MKHGKRTAGGLRGLALGALLASGTGCGGEEVWVGQVEEGLNLNVCAGDEIDCDANVDGETLTTPEPRSCDGELGGGIELDFVVNVSEAVCSDPLRCSAQGRRLAVTAEGAAWVLGTTSNHQTTNGSSLWAARYDEDGEWLGVTDVSTGVPFNGGTVQPEADIAVDEQGHAFVVVYESDGGPNADTEVKERAWFTQLDLRGRPVDGPLALAGIGAPEIAMAIDGRIVIAANGLQNARHGALAKLSAEGERVWSQTQVRTDGQGKGVGVAGLHADASGHSAVLAQRDQSGNDASFGLVRFDSVGNTVWDRVIDRPFGQGYPAELAGDADGNLLVSAVVETGPRRLWLGHVRASGQADWAYELEGSVIVAAAIDPVTGAVYMGGQSETGLGYVAVISPDGEQCERFLAPELAAGAQFSFDGEGRPYFLNGSWFGRLRLLEQ